MKRKLVYFLYSGYIVFLVGLLGSRFANSISKGTLNIICLFIFIGVLAFCCGGFVGYPTRQIDTEQTIKDKLESRDDAILIKELFIMIIPLVIIFISIIFVEFKMRQFFCKCLNLESINDIMQIVIRLTEVELTTGSIIM